MDFEALFYRPRISHLPITFLAFCDNPSESASIVEAILKWREGRHIADEIILVIANEPDYSLPARMSNVRIRYCQTADLRSGSAMNDAFAMCRTTTAFWFDPAAALSTKEFAAYIKALDSADLVLGERKLLFGRLRRPMEWLTRWMMGVLVSDPFFPVFALRLATFRGVEIQCNDQLRIFELIAKSNYLEMLIDPVPVASPIRRPRLLTLILAQPKLFWNLFRTPVLWNLKRSEGTFRVSVSHQIAMANAELNGEQVANQAPETEAPEFVASSHLPLLPDRRTLHPAPTFRSALSFPRSTM